MWRECKKMEKMEESCNGIYPVTLWPQYRKSRWQRAEERDDLLRLESITCKGKTLTGEWRPFRPAPSPPSAPWSGR